MSRVAVIGAGAWGTTLAILLAENKHQVALWSYEKELVPAMNERRENERLRMEREILKKTLRIFSEPPK